MKGRSMKTTYDPTKALSPEGPPVTPQQLTDHIHGRYKASRAAVDEAIRTGAIRAVRIGRRYFIPRRVAAAIINDGILQPADGHS
jgi:hypothetical protein